LLLPNPYGDLKMVYSEDRSTQKDTSSSAVTSSLSLRPKFSPIIARLAASSVVDRLIRDGHLEEDTREDSLEDIAKYARPHMDGYEIAKALDDYASWCIDFQICETLDGFSHEVRSQLDMAERAWVAATNPQPPLAMGSRVQLSRGETGVITGIYEYGAAKYLVKVDGDPRGEAPQESRRIINFEDAVPVSLSEPSS